MAGSTSMPIEADPVPPRMASNSNLISLLLPRSLVRTRRSISTRLDLIVGATDAISTCIWSAAAIFSAAASAC